MDDVNRKQWCSCLRLFADASLYQTWDYASVFHPRWLLSHFIVRMGGEIAGLAQVRMPWTPIFPCGPAFVEWGPLWRRQGAPADLETFEATLYALKEEYVHRRHLLLRIAPRVHLETGEEALHLLLSNGFTPAQSVRQYRTFVVDIARPLSEVRRRLQQKWRNRLHRAERTGLEIRDGISEKYFEEFLAVYRQCQARKKFKTAVNAQRMARLQHALAEEQKMRIFLACLSGRAVAGAVVSRLGDTAIYLIGATSNEALQSQGAYLLQWRIIEWLHACGCRFYDLGGINPDKNPGVYHFKAGLGGTEIQSLGVFECCENSASRRLVHLGERLRRWARL